MAYVPPHKRHSSETKGRNLTPDLLQRKFKKNLNLNSDKTSKIAYANNAIHRMIHIGLDEEKQIPSSIQLQQFPIEEAVGPSTGVETLHLVKRALNDEVNEAHSEQWQSMADNVLQDLHAFFEAVLNEMKGQNNVLKVKPALVVRPGKLLFCRRSKAEAVEGSPTEASLKRMRTNFYTNIPESHIDHIKSKVVPTIGVDYVQEKETYHVKLSDTSRPGTIISCKCCVTNGGSRLELIKVQLDPLRHLVVDISCLEKNMDLRLMLCSKRIVTTLSEEERESIRDLVSSAVLDSGVKGGLRWPFGKASCGSRFRVVGAWHIMSQNYDTSSIRLKLRHADRFDFNSSFGEVTREVVVKLKRVASELLEPRVDIDSISDMLKGELKLIWEHLVD